MDVHTCTALGRDASTLRCYCARDTCAARNISPARILLLGSRRTAVSQNVQWTVSGPVSLSTWGRPPHTGAGGFPHHLGLQASTAANRLGPTWTPLATIDRLVLVASLASTDLDNTLAPNDVDSPFIRKYVSKFAELPFQSYQVARTGLAQGGFLTRRRPESDENPIN